MKETSMSVFTNLVVFIVYYENPNERDIGVRFPSNNGICLVSDKKRDEFVSFLHLKLVQQEIIKYISQFHNS